MTVIPIVFGALDSVTKGMVRRLDDLEIRRRAETIQTTALLRSDRILRIVLETCCHLNSSEKPSANASVKNSKRSEIIIIIIITWTWLRKGNFKRETESLLIVVQNNAIRTNHIKARIDKTQQNSKCRLCGDRDETTNHIISESSKLAQKEYKTRRDWVGKVIHG